MSETSIIPRELIERRRARETPEEAAFWAAIEALHEHNHDLDPDVIFAEVEAAVEEARREIYASRRRTADDDV